MQISNVNNTFNVNHKRITSIKHQGLYKEYPKYAESLALKLKENPSFAEFAKDNNLKIILSAIKSGYSGIESSIKIYYEKPALNKVKQFLYSIFSRPKKIELSMTHKGNNEKECLEMATEKLKSLFVSKEQTLDNNYNSVWSGHLDWRIKRVKD